MFTNFTVGDAISSGLLCAVVMLVLVGNCLVVAAVATSRKLRTVTNMFIVNLACADLLLGVLVLPFSAALEILDTWTFGDIWCQIWLAVDVWLCTASILNLCCISLDRYLAITRPIQYPGIMSAKRVKLLVMGIWIFSFIICCPPLIGWNSLHESTNDVTGLESTTITFVQVATTESSDSNNLDCQFASNWSHGNGSSCLVKAYNDSHTRCELTNSRGYRIYAALGSFFIPMLVMVFFYVQIYRAAVRTILAYEKGELKTKYSSGDNPNGSKSNTSVTLRVHRGGGSVNSNSGIVFSHSPVRKTRSSDASLVTLSDLTPTDSHAGGETPRNSSNSQSKRKDGCISCVKKSKRPATHSFKNGVRGFRLSSQDSEDGYSAAGRTRDGAEYRDGKGSFRISHTRQLSSSQTSDYSSGSFSRDSSEKDKRSKRNMFSVHRPANTMKLHMQKFNREKKAAKTLAIIVGAFIFCWLPFFTIYLVGAFCGSCIPDILFSVAFWLGYCNSAMNPCVYALFSKDFRLAFRKLILCRFWYRSHSFRPQMSDLPAIQLHSPPRENKNSSDLNGRTWR